LFPRSSDRGLIEAHRSYRRIYPSSGFRDHLIAASLKQANSGTFIVDGAVSAII